MGLPGRGKTSFVVPFFVGASVLVAACSGGAPSCGMLSPAVPPVMALASPANGTVGVSPTIGRLYFEASFGVLPVTLSGGGTSSTLGLPVAAASPYPTPLATPSGFPPSSSLYQVAVPALASQTTYTATVTYTDYAGDPPPNCYVTATVGTFRTQ